MGAAFWVDAGLTQTVKRKGAFEPGEAIAKWGGDIFESVGIAAVETRFEPSVALSDLRLRKRALPKPILPLSGAAGEDDVREALNFGSDSLVGRLANSGGPIPGPAGNGDPDVGFSPFATFKNFPELSETDFELGGAVTESRRLIDDRGV